MSARDEVLARVRTALGPDPHIPDIPWGYRTTSDLDAERTLARFTERLDDYRAHVHPATPTSLAALLATLVTDRGHTRVVVPAGLEPRWLGALPEDVEVVRDGPSPHDAAARDTSEAADRDTDEAAQRSGGLTTHELDRVDTVITAAAVAIAETGTIVLDGAADQGRRALTLVPDHHVCVIRATQVVATVPEALARLEPTRPLTLISGPSATSDIELNRVEGVHGPRMLDVVVLEDR